MNPVRRARRALSSLAETAPLPHEATSTVRTHLGELRVIPSVAGALIPPSHHMTWPIFRLIDEASLRRDGRCAASAPEEGVEGVMRALRAEEPFTFDGGGR